MYLIFFFCPNVLGSHKLVESIGLIYTVMDAEMAMWMHLYDGYVMSDWTRLGTHCTEWPPQKQKVVVHLSKTPRKSFSIKALPRPFVILLCIISMLQLSVAIRPAFFMQINLTAQQSVSYASSCSLILHSTPSLPCPLPPFYLIFSGICRGCCICIIYHIRLDYASLKARVYGY